MFLNKLRSALVLCALTLLINAGAFAQTKADKDGFINLIDGQSLMAGALSVTEAG